MRVLVDVARLDLGEPPPADCRLPGDLVAELLGGLHVPTVAKHGLPTERQLDARVARKHVVHRTAECHPHGHELVHVRQLNPGRLASPDRLIFDEAIIQADLSDVIAPIRVEDLDEVRALRVDHHALPTLAGGASVEPTPTANDSDLWCGDCRHGSLPFDRVIRGSSFAAICPSLRGIFNQSPSLVSRLMAT